MAKSSGKNTRATIGGVNVGVKSWKCKHNKPSADTTDTEGNGKRTRAETLEELQFTIEGEFDPALNPMTNAPNLAPGIGPSIQLFIIKADPSKFFLMPVSYIDDVDYDAPVEGVVKFTITGTSNGDFTIPS